MIVQISSPIRALIILLTLIGSFYIFNPYSTSPSNFFNTKRPPIKATPTKITHGATGVKAPHDASPPTMKPHANKNPDTSKSHISGDPVDDPDKKVPRVRQATMIYETVGGNFIYERSIDTHVKHGERWGVPTHVLRHDVIEAGFFNKPAYILGLIIEEMAKPYGKQTEWIVWFDADTVILNPAVPWTLFLPPSDFNDIHILASQDQNGFNAGMAMFRVHEWTVQALSEALALRQLRPEVHIDFDDQGALKWVIERKGYEEHVIYQPHSWWNPFGLGGNPYGTDAFMLHFAGVDCCGQPESKGTVMGRWLDIVENKPEEYAAELEKTKFPKEVDEFWTLLRTAKKTIMNVDSAKDSSRELQVARSELWASYSRHADNATNVTMAIEKVEGIMAEVEVAETEDHPAADKAQQEVQAKKEGESAKKEEKPAKSEEKPAEKEEASAEEEASAKEETSAKEEAVKAKKKALQAEMEAAKAGKEDSARRKRSSKS